MSFSSFLSAVGHDFEKGLSHILPLAAAAEPFVALADPAIGPAYAAVTNLVTGVVLQTEQKFAAMGKQNDTGTQKLGEALSIVTPAATQILAGAGVKTDTAQLTAWVNAVVALLNAYPSAMAAPVAPTPAPAA